ncbi:MAG: hypothetical protein K9I29_09555 [Bacteroidales bacterium]|nr:hypothetical protein [Bacteroidales bacterium]MCF8328524.1 hypothetical protein [Bacteroidales bacterium]
MELDDLKQTWLKYDKKLSDNLKTNRELLKKTNLDRAKSAMDTPKNYEVISLIIGFLFLLYVVTSTIRFSADTKFLLSGTLTSLWTIIMITLTLGKLKLLTNLDFYNQSVLNIQKRLARIKKKYLQYKRFELYTIPLFVIVAAPILAKAMRGFDFFASPLKYAISFVVAVGIGYPITIWIYKNWYDKKLKNTDTFINELEKFELNEQ